MARPQNFDESQVLDAAMQLFWSQGYVGTGMSQLSKATGLKAGSVYNTFSSKKALFLRVLEHYRQTVVRERIALHLNAGHPLDAIEAFFLTAFDAMQKRKIMGCLLTNTATEIGVSDKEINSAVWSGLKLIESGFRRRIIDAQDQGLLSAELDARKTALHLLGCYQGMTVIARLTQDKVRLNSMALSALEAIRP